MLHHNFLGATYQNGKIYHIATKYTKRPLPNDFKLSKKYTNIFHSKALQNWDFGNANKTIWQPTFLDFQASFGGAASSVVSDATSDTESVLTEGPKKSAVDLEKKGKNLSRLL
jgi:hypothetical protein